ncbi:MAG: hypothetical protein GAK30_01525 [Paracidovorax wautersii]|uniref:Uncharacterized protein n=1 Tax=Paracidovorax wautersii TaxID=1177982 RepID=A0A7V8JQV4_9BURK|nr:MAG: hypothetical protein GAK30_01525 [Paracidovorax wautersii]
MSTSNRDDSNLTTVGWVSYILHLVVAVGAVLPGAQASILLLLLSPSSWTWSSAATPWAPGTKAISAGASIR